MSGSAQPGTGIQGSLPGSQPMQQNQFQSQVNQIPESFAKYPPLQKYLELIASRNGMNLNLNQNGAANVFRPQMNAQLPQGMPNYEQLMQQNMLQGQQRVQNVPNVRGFFGSQE